MKYAKYSEERRIHKIPINLIEAFKNKKKISEDIIVRYLQKTNLHSEKASVVHGLVNK